MGTGNWITISSLKQLFKFNIDVYFKKLNYNPLNFNSMMPDKSEMKATKIQNRSKHGLNHGIMTYN